MITIKTFEFNDFHVNTYLLYDETGDCVIIDPGCADEYEENELSGFISNHKLHPVKFFNTHSHVDHIPGNKFVSSTYNIGLEIHKDSMALLHASKGFATVFGFKEIDIVEPKGYVNDGDEIKFGNSSLKVLYTPGHADGSVCFYLDKDKFVIVGDVLFNQSIGNNRLTYRQF